MDQPLDIEEISLVRSERTICVCCVHCHISRYPHFPNYLCYSPFAPKKNYVSGEAYCEEINLNGVCEWYEKLKPAEVEETRKRFTDKSLNRSMFDQMIDGLRKISEKFK